MHTYFKQKGTTNVSIELEIIDATAGTPETGVVWNTAGIDLQYRRDGAVSTAITEATLAALTTAHTDGGFLHIGNGVYRFDLPDAACAAGVDKVLIHGTVTGMVVISCVIQLVDYDPFDAVRMGMTALPNAAADAAGGLATSAGGVTGIDDLATPTNITSASGVSLAATGLDAIVQSAIGMIEIAKAVWDRVLTGGTHNIATSAGRRLRGIQEFQGYALGAIWIDTVNGTAGTVNYENGTVENPVDTIADANTLAASLGISRFVIAPNSTITFAATQANQLFMGHEWTLALGGQNIAGTRIEGATISGVGAGVGHHFIECVIGNISIEDGSMGLCMFTGTITLTGAGDTYWHDCYSGVAGSGTPVLDFGALVGNSNLNMRRYSGGIQIDNKDATGTDLMSLEGNGQLIVSASSSGAISLRGNFTVTNTGGATITYDDNTQNTIDILSDTNAIVVDTNELQTDWTNGGRLDNILDELTTQGDTNEAAIAALNDIAAADVLTQVNAALDTAIAELGVAAPTATPTLRTGLMLMYMMARNRVDVDTTGADAIKLYNDAGTQIASKLITDDGTDYSEAEMT